MPTYFLHTLGCRANQADAAELEEELEAAGWRRTPEWRAAEAAVLNTCSVTAAAEAEARQWIRRLRRQRPDCRVLVTGCYAQRAAAELEALPGVDWVLGNAEKPRLAAHLQQALAPACQAEGEAWSLAPTSTPLWRAGQTPADLIHIAARPAAAARAIAAETERTRPTLKVQEGCNLRCSFCIIPSTRGPARSRPLEEIVIRAQRLAAGGYREIVLSGINLGHWGRDLAGQPRLAHLVETLLERTTVERLRLSSVEVMDWDERLIALLAHPRVARHAHVPLQSGSDAVLRRMRRRYHPEHYAARLARIRAAAPGSAIGADVMAGFPGETEAEFEESLRFIETLPLTYLHVFPYSSRPGTAAARALEDETWQPVPEAVVRRRVRRLRELSARRQEAFARGWLGRKLTVLTLTGECSGETPAISDNYLKIALAGRHAPQRMLEVIPQSYQAGVLRA